MRPAREFVLYWMTEARRTRWNRALTRSLALAQSLGRPLLVLEALRCGDRYASARTHRFLLDGMLDQGARLEAAGVAYYPYVEPVPGAGDGLPVALAERACAVVTDAPPRAHLARLRERVAKQAEVRVESVDGTGLLPRAAIRDTLADPIAFRRRFRAALPPLAFQGIDADPLQKPPSRALERLPKEVADRWHPARKALLDGDRDLLARLSIDSTVHPSSRRGGESAARQAWLAALRASGASPSAAFDPDVDAWIAAGHLSVEEIAHDVLLRDGCIPSVDLRRDDERPEGWWHVRPAADRFLERIARSREHALHLAERHGRDVDRYESLLIEVRTALDARAGDPARPRADIAALEAAKGPDPAWNAMQERLRTDGVLPPSERRAWVFGLFEAAETPRDAYDLAVHLLSRYAVEGADPFALAEATAVFREVPTPSRGRAKNGVFRPQPARRRGRGPRAGDAKPAGSPQRDDARRERPAGPAGAPPGPAPRP
jgi:deoxyribodipyrimidine photo-lyase